MPKIPITSVFYDKTHIMYCFVNIECQRHYAARCGNGCTYCILHLDKFSCRLAQTSQTGRELGMCMYTW